MQRVLTIIILLVVGMTSQAWGQEQEAAEVLFQAEVQRQQIPVLSTYFQINDMTMAYRIQTAFVKKKLVNDKIAGFKAGLTSKPGQQRFGVSSPVAGVLFESGLLSDLAVVDRSNFHQLMLETEIGFIIGTSITEPVEDQATFQKSIKAIVPIVEFPDLGFTDISKLRGVDIVAANVTARKVIIGKPKTIDTFEINDLDVTLSLEGERINTGKATDALGDQWKAAMWLANTMIEQGWALEEGQVLITGALGKMLPAKPGGYVAEYGDLGRISFKVK